MEARASLAAFAQPEIGTLTELLLWHGEGRVQLRRYAKHGGQWQGQDSAEFYEQVRRLEAGLRGELGARAGERVAILAESRLEWLIADFACLAGGLVDVPVYPTLTAEQVAYIVRDAGAVCAFVSTAEQEQKLRSMMASLPALRRIICFESAEWKAMLEQQPDEAPEVLAERLRATRPEQAATLLYTSGTTGAPKGILLTHANLCSNLNVSTRDFDYGAHERRLSILPLAHITERHMAYVDMLKGGEMYFSESLERVGANLAEVHPTVLVSVPRLFEKVAEALQAQVAQMPAVRQALFRWAVRTGERMIPYRLNGEAAPRGLRWRAGVADRLVGRKLRAKMGGRLNKIISGGAGLAPAVARLMLALGVRIDEGYGLSETSPVIALSRPGHRRLGSVGHPLPNLEVKLADDGEILVRGPSVFSGYYHLSEETAEALRGGWFHTGDIGRLDEDGFLYLMDRKKDLIKTSGGKYIAPQPIEAKLKASGLIAEAVVVGDGHNYAVTLLVPNWPAVEARGIACTDRDGACRDEAVRALFAAEIERVNAGLARFETLKKFALVAEEFTIARGELTPTIKVRRRAVAANYRELIASLYIPAKVDSA
ncbi:MAG: AMP-dependent synthetase/ligase [Terriglobales bacterium]